MSFLAHTASIARLRLTLNMLLHAGDRLHFEDRFSIRSQFRPAKQFGNNVAATAAVAASRLGLSHPSAAAKGVGTRQALTSASVEDHVIPCSYAAVFDGHVAANAAQTAAQRLHVLLASELGACARYPPRSSSSHLVVSLSPALMLQQFDSSPTLICLVIVAVCGSQNLPQTWTNFGTCKPETIEHMFIFGIGVRLVDVSSKHWRSATEQQACAELQLPAVVYHQPCYCDLLNLQMSSVKLACRGNGTTQDTFCKPKCIMRYDVGNA